ncbi:MAG: hypothetical protein JNJ58_10595 [Chitinophagaceae bacterium]|nr:hypothetical protein [Chitinophagaceae bacterium]
MRPFLKWLQQLEAILNRCDSESVRIQCDVLKKLSALPWSDADTLIRYHEMLMFLAAHPHDHQVLKLAEKEFVRIRQYFFEQRKKSNPKYNDCGLPYTTMITRFSHELLMWLETRQKGACRMSLDSFESDGVELNTLLRFTLPALERDETTAGLSNIDLLDALHISPKNRLTFLLSQFAQLDALPLIKDYLFESLKLFVAIDLTQASFSRSYNRLPIKAHFFHEDILKRFDHQRLMDDALPEPLPLKDVDRAEVMDVIRKSLMLTMRETDPSSFTDLESLRLYELERGIQIAIYGLKPNRQLALCSYVGYTLFKNGFPAAYGGAWVMGKSARFGLNIFECFRGGESGYMMCQLLRVYRQVFQLDAIEIEPYQFGRDNPDGIKSGAFWFYYRYGFRPADAGLQKLAIEEMKKITARKSYRSSEKTLIRFTDSEMVLRWNKNKPVRMVDVTEKVSQMIHRMYRGDRAWAVEDAVKDFRSKTGLPTPLNAAQQEVLIDVALIAKAYRFTEEEKIFLLSEMVSVKPVDLYAYQRLLSDLFKR